MFSAVNNRFPMDVRNFLFAFLGGYRHEEDFSRLENISMVWINEALGMAVHIVDMIPNRTEKTRLIRVGPFTVRVVGIEDLIVGRLAAAKF